MGSAVTQPLVPRIRLAQLTSLNAAGLKTRRLNLLPIGCSPGATWERRALAPRPLVRWPQVSLWPDDVGTQRITAATLTTKSAERPREVPRATPRPSGSVGLW